MKNIRKEVELFQIENIEYSTGTKEALSLKLIETIFACNPGQSFFVSNEQINNQKPNAIISNVRYKMSKDKRLKGASIKSETIKQHGTNSIIGIRIYRII